MWYIIVLCFECVTVPLNNSGAYILVNSIDARFAVINCQILSQTPTSLPFVKIDAKLFYTKCAIFHWKLPICYEITRNIPNKILFFWNQFTQKRRKYIHTCARSIFYMYIYRNINRFASVCIGFPFKIQSVCTSFQLTLLSRGKEGVALFFQTFSHNL